MRQRYIFFFIRFNQKTCQPVLFCFFFLLVFCFLLLLRHFSLAQPAVSAFAQAIYPRAPSNPQIVHARAEWFWECAFLECFARFCFWAWNPSSGAEIVAQRGLYGSRNHVCGLKKHGDTTMCMKKLHLLNKITSRCNWNVKCKYK